MPPYSSTLNQFSSALSQGCSAIKIGSPVLRAGWSLSRIPAESAKNRLVDQQDLVRADLANAFFGRGALCRNSKDQRHNEEGKNDLHPDHASAVLSCAASLGEIFLVGTFAGCRSTGHWSHHFVLKLSLRRIALLVVSRFSSTYLAVASQLGDRHAGLLQPFELNVLELHRHRLAGVQLQCEDSGKVLLISIVIDHFSHQLTVDLEG